MSRVPRPLPPSHNRAAKPQRVALAFAGGGPLGAIYEIGALCALDDCLDGLDFNACDHYLGVSAGGFIAAALANGMTPRQICDAFIDDTAEGEEHFDPAWLMKPAYDELGRRARRLPSLLGTALWDLTLGRKPLSSALERLGAALPTGVFSNEDIHRQIQRLFSRAGRTNDFRELRARLTLVATHLDSGEAAPFGRPGWDHVPISRAVQASAALPGLFPPVEINGRHYVDGALKKTLHASVALDEGVDLMICLNPLVPFDGTPASDGRVRGRIPTLAEGGLPSVMSQTFRSIIHSRLELGMKQYERLYPDTDIVLLEPDRRDADLFLANTFSYRQRREMAEHAYQQTRALLRQRRTTLGAQLARHGVRLNNDALDDERRHLLKALPTPTRVGRSLARLHDNLDDLQHALDTRALAPR